MKSLLSCAVTLLPLLLALSSCSSSTTSHDNGLRTIHVDVDATPVTLKTSEFLKDAHIISLETNDSCLLDRIYYIKVVNDNIYVYDRSNTIYRFDHDGHFISSLNRKGSGPGEYTSVGGFDVDKFGNIYVSCYSTNSIYVYDKDGAFKDKIALKNSPIEFCVLDDGSILAFFGLKNKYGKKVVAVNNTSTDGYLPVDTLISFWADMIKSGGFLKNGDSVYFGERYNDTVYCINNNAISPVALLDFGSHRLPIDLLHQDYKNFYDLWQVIDDNNYVFNIGTIHYGNSFSTFRYGTATIEGKVLKLDDFSVILDKQTGETKVFSEIIDDLLLFGLHLDFRHLDNGTIVAPIDIAQLLQHAESLSPADRTTLLHRVNYQDEDQNPVIYIATLK